MSILCLFCKGNSRKRLGKSRVVETRTVSSHAKHKGRTVRTFTKERVRQCLTCRWRWKTIEYVEAAKRGKKQYNLGGVK